MPQQPQQSDGDMRSNPLTPTQQASAIEYLQEAMELIKTGRLGGMVLFLDVDHGPNNEKGWFDGHYVGWNYALHGFICAAMSDAGVQQINGKDQDDDSTE